MPPNKCNLLLNRILTAIIITDGTKEDEIKFSNVEEDPSDSQELTQRDPILTQPLTQPLTQLLEKSKQLKDNKTFGSNGQTDKKGKSKNETKVPCRLYTHNSCKYGKVCRLDHPKFCPN